MASPVLTDKKRTLIFVNLLIAVIASSFLSTALSTALPPIIADLHISVSTGQWLTSAFSLVAGIMMPLTAFLITRFPTKKLYLTALTVFTIGLLVCAFASSFPIMMVGRVLQACGNGVAASMAQVVLLSIFPRERQGTIMGWYGLAIGAAPIIAPTIAGILVDSLGWRMVFILPVFVMIIAIVFALIVFDDVLETTVKKFDFLSFILTAFAFSGITLGIGNVTSQGITSVTAFVPLAIGIISSVIFVIRQLKMPQPFLDIRLFRYRNFTLSVIGSMLLHFIMLPIALVIAFYVQSVLGYSATVSGLLMLPGSLLMAFISPLAGKMYDKMGMRNLALIGSLGLIISTGGMSLITMQTPLWVAAILNSIFNVALAFLMMPFVTWGIGSIDMSHTAHGTALINSLRTISGAVGTATIISIMNAVTIHSAATYGANAGIHGVNVTFAVMAFISALILVMTLIWIKPAKN